MQYGTARIIENNLSLQNAKDVPKYDSMLSKGEGYERDGTRINQLYSR